MNAGRSRAKARLFSVDLRPQYVVEFEEKPLPPNQALTTKWPVVGERAARASADPWTVSIGGLVERRCGWTLAELQAMPSTRQVVDIHCVTRWSLFGKAFSGIPLADLLKVATPLSGGRFLSFVARSERNHSTSLPLDDALALGALVALQADDAPLASIHGGPVRMVVPGRYFYKSVKWLEHIEVLAEDRLGYWEAEAGYHNVADPWQEQRYIASQLHPKQVQSLMASRDFSGQNLLSLEAADRDLRGLKAVAAILRNADFRRSNLVGADFTGANLSNAHFEGADLRDACFRNADLEGANFIEANLSGVDMGGASLFGATIALD
jgi:DMSO/TMAO reductase YedYZ molybdopterin-dependent catalytic subunit